MNRAEFRVAYREARKVRRFERTFRKRFKAATGSVISSLSSCDAMPRKALEATYTGCDFLSICTPIVGLARRTEFNPTPRLPA